MLKFRRGKEFALLVEILKHEGIGVLDEFARIGGLGGHVALAVDELNEGQVVVAAYPCVVLAECGGDMDYSGTVGHGNVIVGGNEVSLFILLCGAFAGAGKERLVFFIFKILALEALKHFIGLDAVLLIAERAEHGIHKSLGYIISIAARRLDLAIGLVGVDAEGDVGGQGPGGGRPRKEISVLALDLEADYCRALLDGLVALSHLVRGQGGAAAGAIGDYLEALIKQTLIPYLLERPPDGFDIAVVIGDVGVLHIGPETDSVGEILPHSLILPNALFAELDERLNAVFLYLILAVDAEQLLDLKLDGQTVGIPARLTGHHVALHSAVSGDHILDNSGQNVTDVRLAVGGRRAVVKRVGRAALAVLDALLKDVVLLPEVEDGLLMAYEIKV